MTQVSNCCGAKIGLDDSISNHPYYFCTACEARCAPKVNEPCKHDGGLSGGAPKDGSNRLAMFCVICKEQVGVSEPKCEQVEPNPRVACGLYNVFEPKPQEKEPFIMKGVRFFTCENQVCSVVTFVEPVNDITSPSKFCCPACRVECYPTKGLRL